MQTTTERTTWESGRDAALRGCYRVLVCADSETERNDWLRGFDSVPAENRGKWPLSGPIPVELQFLAKPERTQVEAKPITEKGLEPMHRVLPRNFITLATRDLFRDPLKPREFLKRPFIDRSRWLIRGIDTNTGRERKFYLGSPADLRITLMSGGKPKFTFPRPFGTPPAERLLLVESLREVQQLGKLSLKLRISCDDLRVLSLKY
jgi:hypothetical protein